MRDDRESRLVPGRIDHFLEKHACLLVLRENTFFWKFSSTVIFWDRSSELFQIIQPMKRFVVGLCYKEQWALIIKAIHINRPPTQLMYKMGGHHRHARKMARARTDCTYQDLLLSWWKFWRRAPPKQEHWNYKYIQLVKIHASAMSYSLGITMSRINKCPGALRQTYQAIIKSLS